MCGIGGVLTSGSGHSSKEGLERMAAVMRSRGPDHEGQYVDSTIMLLHRRLSILDLTESGNCPMPNEDGTIQVLLNGEIYNWRELKRILESRGHVFRSSAD